MRRYIKLYFSFAKRSLMSKMVYKSNTIIGIIAFLITEVFSILSLYFIINAANNINGWTMYEIFLLYGITNLAIGIDHMFSDRLWTVAYFEVKQGSLDSLFLRPLPLLFQIFASMIQLEALGEIFTGIALVIVGSLNTSLVINFGNILFLVVGIFSGAIIITSFKIIIASLAFVVKRSGPLLQIVYNFTTYSKYPLTIFPAFIRAIFCFIIPLGLSIYYPVSMLLDLSSQYNPYLFSLLTITISLVFFAVSVTIWSSLAKRYESTGS